MKLLFKYVLFCSLSVLAGCMPKDEKIDESSFAQSMTFGRFITPGCFDSELCVEIFNINTEGLREDINDNFPETSGFYNGNFATPLSQSDYTQVELIFRNNIPEELLQRNSGNVGAFPTWNANYYYFEYKSAGIHKFWIIDGSFDGNLGIVLQNFIQKIQDAVVIASS